MQVGAVAGLWRYPVKSMGGEQLSVSEMDLRGLHADRMWAVRDLELGAVTTARRLPALLGCTARFVDEPAPGVGPGDVCEVRVTLPDGTPLLKGKEVTGFSNVEEDQVGFTADMPFSLEDRMKEVGGVYKTAAEPWGPLTIPVDGGKLITGQNPASSKGIAEALLKAIGV